VLALITSMALAAVQAPAGPVRPDAPAPFAAIQDLAAVVTGTGVLAPPDAIRPGAVYAGQAIAIRGPSSGLSVVAVDAGTASVTQSALSITARLVRLPSAGF
jgi:hypothetical protein